MTSVMENTALRVFLGAKPGVLNTAARWLVDKHVDGSMLDMSGAILVLPTARSRRRILELILEIVEAENLVFTPPVVTTIGTLPELLYRSRRPLATPLQQQLAWIQALQSVPSDSLRVFTTQVPEPDNTYGWLSLANILQSWHHDLAGNALDFSNILETGQGLTHFPERKRWEVLCQVQRSYLDALNDLEIWDRQTARLVAIEQKECQTDYELFLVGTVDLTPTVREMIMQLEDQATCLVFAEPSLEDSFDELGCLDVARWIEHQNVVPDETIGVADQPVDQARLVAEFLSDLDGKFSADEIVIGVPDRKLIPQLNRALYGSGVSTYDLGGRPINQTRPYLLLELIAEWITDERYESFAAMVRHPDMHRWITSRLDVNDWLERLDRFQNEGLPFFMNLETVEISVREKKDEVLLKLHGLMCELVRPLRGAAAHLSHWSRPWRRILVDIYGESEIDRSDAADERLLVACRKLAGAFSELEAVDKYWSAKFDALDALDLVLTELAADRIYDEPIPNAISLLGWLDIPLDDAPVAIISNFNDGWVPSFENSSLFLPNSIRAKLGLVDNERRYARDAYALYLIVQSKSRLRIISGRFDHDNQPLIPSRLLLDGSDEQVAERALRLFGPGQSMLDWSLGLNADGSTEPDDRPTEQQLPIPIPKKGAYTKNSMRVTEFRSYIMCPYRFFLTSILGLERIGDNADEMDAGQFGNLVHEVVEEFGRSEIRNSADLQDIQDFLMDSMNRLAFFKFGKQPLPAVQVQLSQMRLRLQAFANWQVEHRNQGWEIYQVEERSKKISIDLDGKPFEIRGQIDRIDLNHDKKLIGVFDYKTGDAGLDPGKTHLKNGSWSDLQLPLYRWLAREMDLPGGYEMQMAYILLPKDINKVALKVAPWSSDELDKAEQTAFKIMRKVRSGDFWPMSDNSVPPYLWDLDSICQSRVYQRWEQQKPGGDDE